MSSYEIKLNHCVEILNTFPKDCKSLTIHVEDYFKNLNINEIDKIFIIDVFAESIKYHKILLIVINRFYETDGRNIFLSDKNYFLVLLFLLIFRLDEIGLEELKSYFETQKLQNMYKFLNFVTDENNLFTWIELEWRKLYDSIFVENELMDGLKKSLPNLRSYVEEMKNILDNKPMKIRKTIPNTKSMPFNLHKPKSKRIPMPELIPEIEKVKEVPPTTYTPPNVKQKQVKKDPNLLMKEAERLQPACAQREISQKTLEKLNQIVIERDKDLKFNEYKSKPAPKNNSQISSQLKTNTATILREWKLYETRISKKNQELKKLEEGAFNTQQFEAWQQSLRSADLAEKISQLEKLKLAGKISYEEAILKRDRLIQENRELVQSLKKENARRIEKFFKEKALNDEKAKALVEQIIASQEGVKEAKLTVQKKKKAIAKEITEESRRLQEEMLIEAEAEMRRKIDMIAEIRALEDSQSSNQRILDPTEIAGYGLLCEMSLAELKERLILSKQNYEENLNQKREMISDNKQEKQKQIAETVEIIKMCRMNLQGKETLKAPIQAISLENLDEDKLKEIKTLQAQLDEKRSQRKQNRQDPIKSTSNSNRITSSGKIIGNSTEGLEKYSIKSQAGTVERMKQILSV